MGARVDRRLAPALELSVPVHAASPYLHLQTVTVLRTFLERSLHVSRRKQRRIEIVFMISTLIMVGMGIAIANL